MYVFMQSTQQGGSGLGQIDSSWLGDFSLQTLLLLAGGTAFIAWLFLGTPAKERRQAIKSTRERHIRELREVKRTHRRWGKAEGGSSRLALTSYMGHRITQSAEGEYKVPSLDKESWFDSAKDAKAFIRQQVKGAA